MWTLPFSSYMFCTDTNYWLRFSVRFMFLCRNEIQSGMVNILSPLAILQVIWSSNWGTGTCRRYVITINRVYSVYDVLYAYAWTCMGIESLGIAYRVRAWSLKSPLGYSCAPYCSITHLIPVVVQKTNTKKIGATQTG